MIGPLKASDRSGPTWSRKGIATKTGSLANPSGGLGHTMGG